MDARYFPNITFHLANRTLGQMCVGRSVGRSDGSGRKSGNGREPSIAVKRGGEEISEEVNPTFSTCCYTGKGKKHHLAQFLQQGGNMVEILVNG